MLKDQHQCIYPNQEKIQKIKHLKNIRNQQKEKKNSGLEEAM